MNVCLEQRRKRRERGARARGEKREGQGGDGGTPFEQVEVRMVSWRLRTRMKPRATARERAGERERES